MLRSFVCFLNETDGRAFILYFLFLVRAFWCVAVSFIRPRLPMYADGEIASSKTAFSVKFNSFIWICTTGVQFVVGWWYRNAAVFYLPHGWFGPLTWWLSFPFAPKGVCVFLSDDAGL